MKNSRTTIKDLAKASGYSISVVSYVLNNTPGKTLPEETRNKIKNIAKELNYFPNAVARGMRTKKSMAIGIVFYWDVTDPVFIEVLEGITDTARKNGYIVVLYKLDSTNHDFGYINTYIQQQVDGIVFISPYKIQQSYKEEEHIKRIKQNKIPSVFVNGHNPGESISCIYFDYYNTGYVATEYLIKLGHKNIGYLEPNEIDKTYRPAIQRLQAFKDSLQNNKIPVNEKYIYSCNNLDTLAADINSGLGPTAIVINKANYALDLYKNMNKHNINIPNDISVIAANTQPFTTYMLPALTSVRIPLFEIGSKAAEVLFDTIDKKDIQISLKLPNSINVGESCQSI
jgi:LacI family transcriptional regulator